MKEAKKNVLLRAFCAAVCIFAVFCALCFAGCGKQPEDVPPEPTEVSVTISRKTLTVAQWESAILTAEKSGTEEELNWVSDNPEVATVEGGVVTAVSVGEAVITVSAGEVSDKCTVTVVASEIEPTVIVNEVRDQDKILTLNDNSSFDLSAKVMWNNSELNDAVISWTSSDETTVKIESDGNKAVATGLKGGSVVIKVVAKVRGKTAVFEFTVKVNEESALLKAENADYTPYSGGYKVKLNAVEAKEGDGSTYTVPSVYATYKGQRIETENVVWSVENSDIAEVDGATGRITAKRAGETVVTGTWHYDVTDKDYSVKITVGIERVGISIADIFDVVINRAETAAAITLNDEVAESVVIGGKEYTEGFSVENNVLTIGNSLSDVSDQRKAFKAEVITDKRVYTLTVQSRYAIASENEWKAVWNDSAAPAIFGKASVVTIENDIDVSSYSHKNIVFVNSFAGVFDGQGHTITGATASWFGLFNSLAEEGVIKNVAFVGITLLKDAKLFHESLYGTVENCYFEGTHRADLSINAVPAVCNTIGRKAIIRNVVVNIHGRKTNSDIATKNAVFNSLASGDGYPSISGFYLSIDSSSGKASGDSTVNANINLYSSAYEMNESLTALPNGFSSDIWQIYDGVLSFKTSQESIAKYAESKTFNVARISSVMKLTETQLNANFDCKWIIEGLSGSDYSLENGILILNDSAEEGATFDIVGVYTDDRFGFVYEDRVDGVEIKRYTVTKPLEEKPVVGLNHAEETYAFTIDGNDEVLSVSINNVLIPEASYSVSGNKVILTVGAFTAAGDVKVTIETVSVIYVGEAEVYDMAIGTLEEFKAFWNVANMTGRVTQRVVLTADIDAAGYDNGGNFTIPDFAGVLDGKGHTIMNARAGWNGLFYNLTAEGVVRNVAFTGIRFVAVPAVFGYKLEGTVENCYFEGSVLEKLGTSNEGANPALAVKIYQNAVINNVVVYLSNRSEKCASKNGVFGSVDGNVVMKTAPSGVYVINDSSNGKICDDGAKTDISGIRLYSSLADFKSEVTALPEGFSADTWKIYSGILTFISAQSAIDEYIEENALKIESISSVVKLTDTPLAANKTCEWEIEGLDSSCYTIENGVLRLSEAAPEEQTFTVVGRYTEPKFGHVYEDRVENILIKPYVVNKELQEKIVVGLNRSNENLSIALDGDASVTAIKFGTAELAAGYYSQSGNIVTIKASAFTAAGDIALVIETSSVIYTGTVEVYDMAIGTLEEFKVFWSRTTFAGGSTVTGRYVLTADIDASSYGFHGGNVITNVTFNGVLDGKGHTISGVQSTAYGMFFCVGADAIIRNIAFTGIRFFSSSASCVVYDKFEGRMENCYFEGSGGTAVLNNGSALAKRLGTTAVFDKVVVYLHGRPAGTASQAGVFNNLISGSGVTTAPKGVYVINDSSNGNICTSAGTTDISDIHLYSSLAEFKSQNAERPNDISENYWKLLQNLS